MLPSDGDMSGFLAQAQAMQHQLLQAQQELAETELTGSAGGDLVQATVKGTGELVGLVIKPEAVDPEDTETLADLVLAAVRDANNKVQAVTAAKLGPLAGGLGGGELLLVDHAPGHVGLGVLGLGVLSHLLIAFLRMRGRG